MKTPIDIKKYIGKYYFLLFIIFLNIFLIYVAVNTGLKVIGVYEETKEISQSIDLLKANSTLIKNNKELLLDDISNYNNLLDKLIPNSETYFQVISSLEQLENRNGINVVSYSINLPDTTDEKMSLGLTIRGSEDAILSLYENYAFSGGRLMTSETYMRTSSVEGETTFLINLFHTNKSQMSTTNEVSNTSISKDDVDLLEMIRKKI